MFTDLPGAVNISELQWGGEVYTFGLIDPDNDTMTWDIENISPDTNFFYLQSMYIEHGLTMRKMIPLIFHTTLLSLNIQVCGPFIQQTHNN